MSLQTGDKPGDHDPFGLSELNNVTGDRGQALSGNRCLEQGDYLLAVPRQMLDESITAVGVDILQPVQQTILQQVTNDVAF